MSFFLGQADELPEALRIPALLAIPIVVPPLVMLYWLWRVRIGRCFRGIVGVALSDTGRGTADELHEVAEPRGLRIPEHI